MTSCSISEFVSHLKSLDVQLSIQGDQESEVRLRCSAPEGTLTPELRQELATRKAELISYLRSLQEQTDPIIRVTQGTVFPLSFAQQRLWFLSELAPDNPFYNVPAAIRLTGKLDQIALTRSLNEIVRRHATLRTTFTTIDGQAAQVVEPDLNIKVSVVNLQTAANCDRNRISQQLAKTEAQHPFNLKTDPLLRVTVLQFAPTEAVLLLTLHHIVADGWSLGVLIQEFADFYTAFVEGRTLTLPSLPIQYTDFAEWQRNSQKELLERQLLYWREQLQDLAILHLPSDRSRPSVPTYRGATYPLQFSPALTHALEAFSQQSGVSLFMTLLAAFQTLLYRYTGQEDIAIGSPIANRHRSELEGLIGFFVNSLVMRSDLSGNPTFRELLNQVRTIALEAYEHQDLPFEKLVEDLAPDRDSSRNPLFQVAFALQNAPMQPLELPGLILEPAPLESGSVRFDLEVHLWEPNHGLRSLWQSQEGLSGFVSYSTDLFDQDRIKRLVEHFQTLLESIVANPNARLSDLALLTDAECQQIAKWNQTETHCKHDRCFHQIFEEQVQQNPDAIAVVSEQGSLTYSELNQKADQLAQTLRQMGVQSDFLVGVCVERSLDMIVGILGILKAGGAYVPLDPNYPSDRLQFMVSDTQVSILLTQSWIVEKLPRSQAKLLCLDQPLPISEPCSLALPTLDHLAYVIYTSGSTGTPKGVLLSHRGLFNVVQAQQIFHPSRSSRILQFSSLSFDASIFEIVLALSAGSTLYIPPQFAQLPGMQLIQFLEANQITHALLTPAVLAVLPPAKLPALEVLITGGEACSGQIVDRWAVDRQFFNAYGPTETTIWATVAELRPGDNPLIIGRPIQNTQIQILDAHLKPVPIGIPGELYISGAGLAQGYLNRPALTAERFIRTEHAVLYKTGDRAFYRNDGTIEFLGRMDDQVKIRGFRVELGEIEATLQRHPAIQDAIVTASETNLIAYFSLNPQFFRQARSLETQYIDAWQTLYNQTYQSSTPSQTFNITGWNSTYTGEAIPPDQMQEWLHDRVAQILALQPKRVLEVGCGTGLLLFQIAPHCQKYVATDFSEVSLASIQSQLETLPQVELLHRTATDFDGINAASFDLVILNSIVQYFPSVNYLMEVLEQAMLSLAPGGVLFIGDVRSLPLLTAFHAWTQFYQADAALERTQLQQSVARSQFEEPELAIDPMFFHALRRKFSQIKQVQIRLSRGRSHNEMTQFRYSVLLHLDRPVVARTIPQHDWKLDSISVEKIQNHLLETDPEQFILTNVNNSRVSRALKTVNWLHNQTSPKTVGRMRERLQDEVELAIDPQDWWNLETVLPYRVEITWSTHPENYDVLFIRNDVEANIDLPIPAHSEHAWNHYTNHPLQSQFACHLIPELRESLRRTLPDYMLPSAFVSLGSFPLTTNGKVDRRALPPPREATAYSPSPEITSSTQTETALTEIWRELLRLKHINRHDNFFELGGHSLLATQMTSRVRDTFGLELPLKSVFEAPTIAQLAPILETLLDTAAVSKIPPLVRLDRSAHRHPQSTRLNPYSQVSSNARSPLVPLMLGGSQPPFFCVHPLFGVVFPYLELAHYLNCDRSFYGLQPLGLDGKATPLNRIEAIAAYYIQAIRTIQPHGPYLLGGWSFGGLVAFEMAQQLTQAGQQIELLAILDIPAPCLKPSIYQSLQFLLGTVWSTLPFLLDYGALATNRSHSLTHWISRWQWSRIVRLIPEESRLRLLDESTISSLLRIVYAHVQATSRYVPKPYVGRITLFKAIEQSGHLQEPTFGWSTLANDVQVHPVTGNHLSLLKPPHVQTLARQLEQYL